MSYVAAIVRKLYVVIVALLLFPIGWASGTYMVSLTGSDKWGYGLGFAAGATFLALPFIVNWFRRRFADTRS
jgi:hypothetical protein